MNTNNTEIITVSTSEYLSEETACAYGDDFGIVCVHKMILQE